MRPLASVAGHPLDAMDAGFELQPREHALAGDVGDDFLVAAGVALALRQHLDLPAVKLGVALVHAEQVAGEQRRLVAAGAGPDFDDRALLVGRVLGQEQEPDLLGQVLDPRVERLPPRLRPAPAISGSASSASSPSRSAERRPQLGGRLVDRLELGPLAAEPDQRVAVERRRQPGVDDLDAGDQRVDLLLGDHGHGYQEARSAQVLRTARLRRGRSRPAPCGCPSPSPLSSSSASTRSATLPASSASVIALTGPIAAADIDSDR